tara:strand:+ start:7219 stop:7593 length:375 start_codon:yes stop_codon:yes gene_type:complete
MIVNLPKCKNRVHNILYHPDIFRIPSETNRAINLFYEGSTPLHLTAKNPSKNIYRFYTIFTSKDLFGFTCIHTCYGRIGTKGKMNSYSFLEKDKAERYLNTIMNKRLNASKRIGVDYNTIKKVI